MRGVGQEEPDSLLRDNAVGVYLDDVYVGHGNGLSSELGDTERVEVLPGPQGTLYGRNTIGGAVKFVSVKPTGQLGIKQNLDGGNYNYFHSLTNIDLPEVAGLAAKISFLKSDIDGVVKNAGTGRDFGEKDARGFRFALRWRATEKLAADYVYDYSKQTGTSNYQQHQYNVTDFGTTFPLFPTRQTTTWRPVDLPIRDNFKSMGHALTLTWDVAPSATLKSITAYRQFQGQSLHDAVEGYSLPAVEGVDTTQHQVSQEFLLTGGTANSHIKYHLGLFYFKEGGRQSILELSDPFSLAFADPYLPPTVADTFAKYILVENRSKAIYGDVTWIPPFLDDRLSVDVGGRYSKDNRDFHRTAPDDTAGTATASAFDPSITLDYKWTASLHTYAKLAKAYRSGGFDAFNTVATLFKPEHLTSYEVGWKSQWWNDRLRINVDAFREKYKDIQLSFFSPDFTEYQTVNAASATIKGVEGELVVLPFEGLTLSGSFTRLQSDSTTTNPYTSVVVSGQLPNIPKMKYSLSAEYGFTPFSFGTLSALVSYDYHDKQLGGGAAPDDFKPAYGLIDGRVTLSEIAAADGRLAVSLWGRNLANRDYEVYHNFNAVIFGMPRSFGVNLSYDYR